MSTNKINKLLLPFLLLFFVSSACIAQDQLILKNGEIIKGSALTINKAKVRFEDAYTGRRKWYKKKQIEKLMDKQDGGAVIEYKVRNIKGISSYLSGALITGKANLFIIHKATPGYQGIASFVHLYKKGESRTTLVQANSLTTPFYKRMSKYFSDCTKIVSKLKAKKYKTDEILEIVKDYNSICTKR